MLLQEKFYAVLLYGRRVGTIIQRGDHTRFRFSEEYLEDPARPVLGLRFEEKLRSPYAAALRLPPWFSNLLPEGTLRRWVAGYGNVSVDREMELLAQVGHDLPGAVQILAVAGPESDRDNIWEEEPKLVHGVQPEVAGSVWRFSLAGMALKFSMLGQNDRLVVPAAGDRGDWIVKFPDQEFVDVPRNEYAMMSFASAVGIEVPDVRLVHRDELTGLPARLWRGNEEWAYAVRRFDRAMGDRQGSVHIEDLAQVRDIYPEGKYQGTFESVASLLYRGRDLEALREFARRLTFTILIGNGDGHLKNWSLIYLNRKVPTLSPAYDLVSTAYYYAGDEDEDLGLRFCGGRRFEDISLACFQSLEARLDRRFGKTGAGLVEIARETIARAAEQWPRHRELLLPNDGLERAVGEWIDRRVSQLQAGA